MAWGDDGRIVVSPGRQLRNGAGPTLSGWTAAGLPTDTTKRFAAAPMLRKSFDVTGEVRNARLYMSAAAYGKMRLNGASRLRRTALNRVIRITTNGTCTVPMT